jgi:SAM-dependent methyltransferase
MSDSRIPEGNAAQIDYWNALAGQTWVQFHDQLDRQLESLGLAAMDRLAPAPGERVLDVGCGCGHTTLALAERLAPAGQATGVDISRAMLEVGRARTVAEGLAAIAFREADAQQDDLGQGQWDGVFSRFGVMFFSDPVAAFANLRRSLRPGGRLAFVCWRPFAENDWMRIPMMAALPLLTPPAPADPTAPGPFAFADPERVMAILKDAGFAEMSITPFDTRIGGADLDQTVALTLKVGPLGSALRESPDLAEPVAAAVRTALEPYETPEGVLMPAAVWLVSARTV